LRFEIAALFCSQHGPNFRNEIAHGLAPEQQLSGRLGVYAWWMVFRMVFNVFWNGRRRSPETEQEDGAPTSEETSSMTPSADDEDAR
jgi:hypothetical protein